MLNEVMKSVTLSDRIRTLIRRRIRELFFFPPNRQEEVMWSYSKMAAALSQSRGFKMKLTLSPPWSWTSSLRTVINNFLLLKLLSLWYFVMSTWADEYTVHTLKKFYGLEFILSTNTLSAFSGNRDCFLPHCMNSSIYTNTPGFFFILSHNIKQECITQRKDWIIWSQGSEHLLRARGTEVTWKTEGTSSMNVIQRVFLKWVI